MAVAITGITTLGIGPTSGANIEHFILLGLNIPKPFVMHGNVLGGMAMVSHDIALQFGSVAVAPYDVASMPPVVLIKESL